MITLKHLMQEFKLDSGNLLRKKLRAGLPMRRKNQRWQWPDENDLDYLAAREIAKQLSTKDADNA